MSLWKLRGVPRVQLAGTLAASGTLETDGSASDLDADWLARVNAAGVLYTQNFDDPDTLLLDPGAGGSNPAGLVWTQPSNVVAETTIKRAGARSARVNIPASSGSDPGSLRLPIGSLRGNGSVTYYSYSIYTPEAFLRYKPTYETGGSGGWKSAIVSHTSGSNQPNEVVVQDTNRRGVAQVYWQDGTGFVDGSEGRTTPGPPTDTGNFAFQTGVDRGAPASPATDDEYESRYGLLYSNDNHPGGDNSAAPGSDSFSAGFPYSKALIAAPTWKINGWNAIKLKVTIGTMGTASSRVEAWFCRPGEAWVKIQDRSNITLGNANGGHNCVWLLPYETDRAPSSVPETTFVCYAEFIASANDIAAPAVADAFVPPYSLPSGAGNVVAIGTNTASDITPSGLTSTEWNYALFDSWSGGALIEDASRGGFYGIAGSGGHVVPRNVGMGGVDFTDATWKRIDNTNGATYSGTDYTVSQTSGSPYYEVTGAGQTPAPAHLYQAICQMPASAGGGVKGSLIRITGSAMCQESVSTNACHAMAVATGKWSRPSGTSQSGRVTFQQAAVWDPTRRRWWFMPDGISAYSNIQYFDAETLTWQNSADYPSHVSAGGLTLYDSDYLVGLRDVGGNVSWHVLNLNNITAGWVTPTVSGSPGTNQWDSWVYHPRTGHCYQIGADGGTTLRRMRNTSGNPDTGSWTADTITLSQSLPARFTLGSFKPHYSALFYVPSIDRIAYVPGGSESVYLIEV